MFYTATFSRREPRVRASFCARALPGHFPFLLLGLFSANLDQTQLGAERGYLVYRLQFILTERLATGLFSLIAQLPF